MIQNKHRFIHTKEVAFTFLLDKSSNVSAILGFKSYNKLRKTVMK